MATGAPPPDWMPGITAQADFEINYPRRVSGQFRPLSTREQRERAWAVRRERAGWAWRDLRADPMQSARMLAGLAMARVAALRRP